MWEFSVGLYMINIWPDSLLLAAAYGVVESASTALFGPLIGELVDKLSYTRVCYVSCFLQVSFQLMRLLIILLHSSHSIP